MDAVRIGPDPGVEPAMSVPSVDSAKAATCPGAPPRNGPAVVTHVTPTPTAPTAAAAINAISAAGPRFIGCGSLDHDWTHTIEFTPIVSESCDYFREQICCNRPVAGSVCARSPDGANVDHPSVLVPRTGCDDVDAMIK
jgi:hypothetical protein